MIDVAIKADKIWIKIPKAINETWKSDTFRNHGKKLWLFQFPNPERIILILLIIDLLLSQVAFVKLLKEWSMNILYGISKRIVYWLNNSVVIGQIDWQLII